MSLKLLDLALEIHINHSGPDPLDTGAEAAPIASMLMTGVLTINFLLSSLELFAILHSHRGAKSVRPQRFRSF